MLHGSAPFRRSLWVSTCVPARVPELDRGLRGSWSEHGGACVLRAMWTVYADLKAFFWVPLQMLLIVSTLPILGARTLSLAGFRLSSQLPTCALDLLFACWQMCLCNMRCACISKRWLCRRAEYTVRPTGGS